MYTFVYFIELLNSITEKEVQKVILANCQSKNYLLQEEKTMKNIFVGGAWPYANNSLHLGHIAALLPGDIIARYFRKCGNRVLYVSGTDCHGTPITLRAKKEHIAPEEIALTYHNEFKTCFEKLGFSYDKYTLTCNDFHKHLVQEVIKLLNDENYIYEKTELQDFCETCNQFLSDREIEGTCPICGGHAKGDQCDDCHATFNPTDIKNKVCKHCGTPVSHRANTHLYWKLSAFQEAIFSYVSSHEDLWRFNAVNESKKYLKSGLPDRAITRQLDWGVDVPISGFEDKKIYVWIEAVLGYISTGIAYCNEHNLDWRDFYLDSPNLDTYYVHGKDNIPFHTIIYPALLLSIGHNFQLPKHIVSSEFLNIDDEKISKSKGNGIAVKDIIEAYQADTLRYCLIYQGPERKDTNFTFDILHQLHNKSLVGEYGNFVNRNLAYLVKKFNGIIPSGVVDSEVKATIDATYEKVGELIAQAEFRAAIQEIQQLVRYSNKYYDDNQPWIKVKEDINEFNNITATCISLIANIANLYEPFIPFSSEKVFSFFGIKNPNWGYISVEPETTLKDVSILFSRID